MRSSSPTHVFHTHVYVSNVFPSNFRSVRLCWLAAVLQFVSSSSVDHNVSRFKTDSPKSRDEIVKWPKHQKPDINFVGKMLAATSGLVGHPGGGGGQPTTAGTTGQTVPSNNSSTSPTPSLDSLNGMPGGVYLPGSNGKPKEFVGRHWFQILMKLWPSKLCHLFIEKNTFV